MELSWDIKQWECKELNMEKEHWLLSACMFLRGGGNCSILTPFWTRQRISQNHSLLRFRFFLPSPFKVWAKQEHLVLANGSSLASELTLSTSTGWWLSWLRCTAHLLSVSGQEGSHSLLRASDWWITWKSYITMFMGFFLSMVTIQEGQFSSLWQFRGKKKRHGNMWQVFFVKWILF